jgi:tRNA(Phe) wybutosine-synthesizing methylase Tyw3
MKLQNSISPCKVDELRKSFEVDKETMQAAINRASNIMDEQSKRISELEEELNKLSKPVTKMP